jgi:hypothetical protein
MIPEAVKEYQCPGCVGGEGCYKNDDWNTWINGGKAVSCVNHAAGTILTSIGKILLGLPIGFNRLGPADKMPIQIFEEFHGGYGKYNIPVWKYLDSKGNTIIRGISPRINYPFLHIIIGNHLNKIDCLEITDDDIAEMD